MKLVFASEIVTVPEAEAEPLGRLKKPFNLGFKAFPGSMLTSWPPCVQYLGLHPVPCRVLRLLYQTTDETTTISQSRTQQTRIHQISNHTLCCSKMCPWMQWDQWLLLEARRVQVSTTNFLSINKTMEQVWLFFTIYLQKATAGHLTPGVRWFTNSPANQLV